MSASDNENVLPTVTVLNANNLPPMLTAAGLSPNSISPTFPKLPGPRTGKFRGSRHSGIWALVEYSIGVAGRLKPIIDAMRVHCC